MGEKESLGAVARDVVEARLQERFSQVTVSSSPARGSGVDVRVAELTYGSCADDPISHCATVRLEVTGERQASFTGEGRGRQSAAHLAWIIPTVILGFPIAASIPAAVMPRVRRRIGAGVIARAIDDAARQMAVEL